MFIRLCSILGLLVTVSACAEIEFLVHTTKQIKNIYDSEEKAKVHDKGSPVPKGYKVGNAYKISGIWYYPYFDPNYDKTGIASWYGKQFHGKLTANGEIFDMNTLTAAHKTFPLPSIARVTNLENNRQLLVRVNDRGPFVNNRIIDLSRRSAQLLGVYKPGTAEVRVQFVELAKLKVLATYDSAYGNILKSKISSSNGNNREETSIIDNSNDHEKIKDNIISIESIDNILEDDQEKTLDQKNEKLYIQLGAFSQLNNALRLRNNLSEFGNAQISESLNEGKKLYRVRIGPLKDLNSANELIYNLNKNGIQNVHIVNK